MQKIMFYCQHILGMGHLVRSMEIVRELVKDFQICFINGGEIIAEFQIPEGVEVINLPAIKTDAEFQQLQPVDSRLTLDEVKDIRCKKLIEIVTSFCPDILLIELFPFGRGKFKFELLPLLEKLKQVNPQAKVVSSLRDIVETKKKEPDKYEEKVCQLMNRYFDLLLIHGDPQFQTLEETFSRVKDIRCPIVYTGYVVQPETTIEPEQTQENPIILVSVGGGRFGHELLDILLESAPILRAKIPHSFQIFTGPFMPEEKFIELQTKANNLDNVRLERFTSNLLSYMNRADLSISMSGYNTTMNVLTTGVRSMLMAFTGNDDREQTIRSQKLADLGIVELIQPEDLEANRLADKIINCLQQEQNNAHFDFAGAQNTSKYLKELMQERELSVSNNTFSITSTTM
jgi:predicted glycosyltransferase